LNGRAAIGSTRDMAEWHQLQLENETGKQAGMEILQMLQKPEPSKAEMQMEPLKEEMNTDQSVPSYAFNFCNLPYQEQSPDMIDMAPCIQNNLFVVPMVAFQLPTMNAAQVVQYDEQMMQGQGVTFQPMPQKTGPLNDVPEVKPPASWTGVTTIMIRHIPNKYTQALLMEEIEDVGFAGSFDFIYVPIDLETNANKGYAFINFVDTRFAWLFKCIFDDKKMKSFNTLKLVKVVPAALQGFDANYEHFSCAKVSRGDPKARPLFLRSAQSGGSRQRSGANSRWNGQASDLQSQRGLTAKYCPQCGTSFDATFKFCVGCGYSLGQAFQMS